MGPSAHILPDGKRLHLQHGPIDLIIGADGDRLRAFEAARACLETVLATLVSELPALRQPMTKDTSRPAGPVARRMHRAALPHTNIFVTRMAAVAGAVADHVLTAMLAEAELTRAYVNNGGDIALHLTPGTSFSLAMKDHANAPLGRIHIPAADGIGGIATSGRHGRSLSMGIADSVTVLAPSAAAADIAATLIANAVDLPDHPAIRRKPASDIADDSDLGQRPVVVGCGKLGLTDRDTALARGLAVAKEFQTRGLIADAALFLQGAALSTGHHTVQLPQDEKLHA